MSRSYMDISVGELKNAAENGFSKLRDGALYNLYSTAISFIAVLILFATLFPLIRGAMRGAEAGSISSYYSTTVAASAVIFIILIVIALYMTIKGYKLFMEAGTWLLQIDSSLGLLATGPKLVYYGSLAAIVLVPLGILLAVAGAASSNTGLLFGALGLLGLAILSLIGVFIGFILFGIGLHRVPEAMRSKDIPCDPNIGTAGLLLLIGGIFEFIGQLEIIGALLGLVGMYLLYTGSKNTLEELKHWHPVEESETLEESGEESWGF